jgi:hypothetical protein
VGTWRRTGVRFPPKTQENANVFLIL